MVHLTATALLASFLAAVSAGTGQHQLHGHLHRRSIAPSPPKYDSPVAPTYDAPAAPKHDVPPAHKPEASATSCGCSTYTTTWYVTPTLYSLPKPSTAAVEVKPTPPAYAPKKVNKPSGYGAIAPNGNKWAMTYTPYRPDG